MKLKIFLIIFVILVEFIGCKNLSVPTEVIQPVVTQISIDSEVLVSVPGGTFTQTDGNESFSHTISEFMIGKYEVTYDLWYTVYQWAILNGYSFQNPGREGSCSNIGLAPTGLKYEPVTDVNWRDCIVWCNAYSQMKGFMAVYYTDEAFTIPIMESADGAYGSSINTNPGSFDNPYINWAANGYRLPTEGEWQYAASYIDGASWTPYNYASGATASYVNLIPTGLVAWCWNNSWDIKDYCTGHNTHIVGGKTANALGIHDMSGNVWEWCWDWYGNYPAGTSDYRGPASSTYRVIRGGYFLSGAIGIAVGSRYLSDPFNDNYDYMGFRFARTY